MYLIQKLAQKLGKFTQRKAGEEFIFACPKCHHVKMEINPSKKLFHCFRCSYKGALSQILRDLNIEVHRTTSVRSMKKPILIETQECEIPRYEPTAYAYFPGFIKGRGVSLTVSTLRRWGISKDRQLKNRLIIPIIENKIIVNYIARSVDGSEPKELAVPNRSWYLYGIDDVKKDEPVVVVEGVFDAEAVRRAEFNAVAIMGSNLSDIQVGKLLAKKPYPIILMLDGDKAGREGTLKAYKKLIKRTHMPVLDVYLDEGVDPDEVPIEALQTLLRDAWRSGG